jgi:acyl-CoA thioesterase-1
MKGARFKLTGIIMAVLALVATMSGQAGAAPLKLLAFGTSLTQSFGVPPGMELPAVLQAKLDAAHIAAHIINAGISGDTSADGLSRIDWSLADHPDAAMVELGSNDALRGIDPVQTEQNISSVLEKLTAAHVPVLLLGMKAPRNLGREYATAFDAIYPRLAARYHAILYPFVLDGVALDPKLNQEDGIHPNPAGVKVIAARLFPYVQKLIVEAQHKKDPR